ncbi:MAG: type II 3-dehydroquinate dehydratase [Gemmatimonadota bacterium]
MRIGVLNGPNLDRLGTRDPAHYGHLTLPQIEAMLRERAAERGVTIEFFQANHEGALVERIAVRAAEVDGWLVNAAALTHTSIALRDALEAAGRPFVELHLSNVFAREAFRHRSMLADRAIGVIAGFRARSYALALDALVAHLCGELGTAEEGSGTSVAPTG